MVRIKSIFGVLQTIPNGRGLTWLFLATITAGWTGHAEPSKEVEPVGIYIHTSENDTVTLSFQQPDSSKLEPDSDSPTPFFFAIKSPKWPNGMIPIYQARDKQTKQWKLNRRLTHGKENFTDPLFFALPPASGSNEGILSGRWACEAKHWDGSIDFLHWEMALDGETIFGRFDQDTDYRFAWLIGGTFKDPSLHFKAEYIDANYELEGSLTSNILKGTWKQTEDADGGTWTAEPAYPVEMANGNWKMVHLYQTTSPTTGKQELSVGDAMPLPDDSQILCRVWLPKKQP